MCFILGPAVVIANIAVKKETHKKIVKQAEAAFTSFCQGDPPQNVSSAVAAIGKAIAAIETVNTQQ